MLATWFPAIMKFNIFNNQDRDLLKESSKENEFKDFEKRSEVQEVLGPTDGYMKRKKTLTSACRKLEPVVLVHGGAGSIPDSMVADKLNCVKKAALAGYKALKDGKSSADAVEAAIRVMEDDPVMNAGTGSVLNFDGDVETDACIMVGQNLDAGGVTAVKDVGNPISLAKMVMEKTPHNLLAGDGARKFAKENGYPLEDPGSMVTLAAKNALQYYKDHPEEDLQPENWSVKDAAELQKASSLETVGAIVLDRNGHLAAGTSTGGLLGKLPGRVGDSPQIGKGAYCDDDLGGVSVTGHGEELTRYCLSARILKEVEHGKSALEAVTISIKDMEDRFHKEAGAICVTRTGDIGWYWNSSHMSWAYIRGKDLHYGIKPGEDNVEAFKV